MAISPPVDVAIVATSQTPAYRAYNDTEVALIMSCANDVISQVGMDRHDIDFTIAGSCDYLSGMPFAFVSNLDGVGAWPPIYENHVEMDAAWALFEAWVRLQHGDIQTVLVSGSGKSSPGRPRDVFPLQTDPYFYAPLGLDPVTAAGLAARAMLDSGVATENDFAQVVSRSRRDALHNPNAQVAYDKTADELLAEPYFSEPLRKHDLPHFRWRSSHDCCQRRCSSRPVRQPSLDSGHRPSHGVTPFWFAGPHQFSFHPAGS